MICKWLGNALMREPNNVLPPESDSLFAKDDEIDATSQMDVNLDASTGEEMDTSGYSCHLLSVDRHCQRNCALQRECNRAR